MPGATNGFALCFCFLVNVLKGHVYPEFCQIGKAKCLILNLNNWLFLLETNQLI